MKSKYKAIAARAASMVALMTPLMGCSDLGTPVIDQDQDPLYNATDNGLGTVNGLSTTNGLGTVNGLSTTNGLGTVNGLSTTNGLMTGATSRVMVKYLAKCALATGTNLVKADQYGTMYTFAGALGLGSTWLTGTCDANCQQRVSSCLLAMANRDGKHVSLELVSAAPSLSVVGPTGDDVTYPNQEGSVFGNLFPSPPQMYTCAGTEGDHAAQVKRFCINGPGCDLFTKTAPCATACTQTCTTGPGGKKICAASSCKSANGTTWAAPLTIYLRNRMEAGNFDATGGSTFGNGVTVFPMVGGTQGIAGVDDQDWTQMNDVQFGAAGSTKTFTAYISTLNAGNVIELRLDTVTGPIIASLTTTSTGSMVTEVAETAAIASAGISGSHNVFMTFNGAANRASGLNGGGKSFGNISYFEVK